MSSLKMILGFIVGVLACAILFGLISIRAPILVNTASGDQTGQVTDTLVASNSEQTTNASQDALITPVKKPYIDPGQNERFDMYSTPSTPDQTPILSIILTDMGAKGAGVADIVGLSTNVAMAIDAAQPNAQDIGSAYGDAGLEVLAMMTDDDVLNLNGDLQLNQMLLEFYFSNASNAIGVIDAAQGSLQKNKSIYAPFIQTLKSQGAGLVTYSAGINNTLKIAQEQSLPAGLVFQVLDAKFEAADVIAEYLDTAVKHTNDAGAVIVMGEGSARTIGAIQEWLANGNSQDVIIAPVSEAMRRLAH